MNNLRSKLIRLAHQKPALRPHLLPLLREAAGPKEIVDPQTGKNWEDLKNEYEETLSGMYDQLKGLFPHSREYKILEGKLDAYRKEVGSRLNRLRVRMEKAKIGLRLSSLPKYMSKMPQRGDWGYLGSDSTASAILRGDEVVGWVIGKESRTSVTGPGSAIQHGVQVRNVYTPYTLEGKKIPGAYNFSRTADALEAFHRKAGL